MKPHDIRELRESLGMTQQEFAAKVGLKTRGAVSKIESGTKEAKGALLAALRLLALAYGEKQRGKR